jgi:hypothetical protein
MLTARAMVRLPSRGIGSGYLGFGGGRRAASRRLVAYSLLPHPSRAPRACTSCGCWHPVPTYVTVRVPALGGHRSDLRLESSVARNDFAYRRRAADPPASRIARVSRGPRSGLSCGALYGAPQVGLARQAPELPLQRRSPEMPQGQHCSALVAVRQYIPMM